MSIKEATEIVANAALQHANGSWHPLEIMEAVETVRAYVREQEDK